MNQKDDINLVIQRFQKSLLAAKVLLENELYADSVSDSYYAMFHAATACLHTINITVKTHSSVAAYFSKHFVQTNLIKT
ncbi:MAG: HEPN domain-containing protein [Cytophagales bacterium]